MAVYQKKKKDNNWLGMSAGLAALLGAAAIIGTGGAATPAVASAASSGALSGLGAGAAAGAGAAGATGAGAGLALGGSTLAGGGGLAGLGVGGTSLASGVGGGAALGTGIGVGTGAGLSALDKARAVNMGVGGVKKMRDNYDIPPTPEAPGVRTQNPYLQKKPKYADQYRQPRSAVDILSLMGRR